MEKRGHRDDVAARTMRLGIENDNIARRGKDECRILRDRNDGRDLPPAPPPSLDAALDNPVLVVGA
jgi:hypothetical protein